MQVYVTIGERSIAQYFRGGFKVLVQCLPNQMGVPACLCYLGQANHHPQKDRFRVKRFFVFCFLCLLLIVRWRKLDKGMLMLRFGLQKQQEKVQIHIMFTKKNFATCGVSEVFGNYGWQMIDNCGCLIIFIFRLQTKDQAPCSRSRHREIGFAQLPYELGR